MQVVQENKAGKWIALAISLPLSAFTIWRAWDIMTAILPPAQSLAAVFGIAALDGGMVGWIFGYMKSKSSDQRLYSGIAGFCDFVGVGLVTFVDLLKNGVAQGLVSAPANLFLAAIILISVAVVLNIGFGWLYVLGDPVKKQEIRDQKAHDKINDLSNAMIEQNAAMFAPQFAQVKVQQWLQEAQMMHNVGQLSAAPTIDSTLAPHQQLAPVTHPQAHPPATPPEQKQPTPPPAPQAASQIDYDLLAQALHRLQPPTPEPTTDPLAAFPPTQVSANGNSQHGHQHT